MREEGAGTALEKGEGDAISNRRVRTQGSGARGCCVPVPRVGKLQQAQVNQRKKADSRADGCQGSAFTVQVLKSVFCQIPWTWLVLLIGACVLGQAEGKWDEDLSARGCYHMGGGCSIRGSP